LAARRLWYIMHRAAKAPCRRRPVSSTLGVMNDKTVVIRPFRAEDHAAALALWRSDPGVGLSSADEFNSIARFLNRNPGTNFVAESEDQIVGTILCGHDGRRGLIHHLAVATTCRRRGVGLSLLRAGLSAMHAAGIDKCHLLVFKSNEPGLAFWHAVQAVAREELALFSLSTTNAA
jgi:N-acetylglutamate synthase